jgi:nickel transport protein
LTTPSRSPEFLFKIGKTLGNRQSSITPDKRGVPMKKIKVIHAAVGLIFIGIVFLGAGSASAHRVNVFAWVEGDTVYLESKFAGGRPVKSGRVVVLDPEGIELLTGLTNDEGEFSFKIPMQADLKIVLNAGQGHQAEWTVRAEEMEKLLPATAPETGAEKVEAVGQKNAASKRSEDKAAVMPATNLGPQELEAIIDSALDRKLKPITRMLADMQQEGPSVKDIFAGIGYIFGLFGVAAYVHSRRNKD